VLEAFASGCAVVSTNAGGVPAILTHETHGLLVTCNDHEAAAREMIRLVEDPALADRLTTAARESCERYRWQNVRAQWLALYNSLARTEALAATTAA
jgi:L-malate glycosyltransferase